MMVFILLLLLLLKKEQTAVSGQRWFVSAVAVFCFGFIVDVVIDVVVYFVVGIVVDTDVAVVVVVVVVEKGTDGGKWSTLVRVSCDRDIYISSVTASAATLEKRW